MATLQEGQTLLERIRKAALLCTYSTARHATTSACHAIERLLQLLRDKWRKLDELWVRRLLQLQQCLQLGLADQEATRVGTLGFPPHSTDVLVGWLGSRVVSVLDSDAEGPGFKSQPRRCRVTVLGKLFTPIVPSFTMQRNW